MKDHDSGKRGQASETVYQDCETRGQNIERSDEDNEIRDLNSVPVKATKTVKGGD
jgi:hypothetical protein